MRFRLIYLLIGIFSPNTQYRYNLDTTSNSGEGIKNLFQNVCQYVILCLRYKSSTECSVKIYCTSFNSLSLIIKYKLILTLKSYNLLVYLCYAAHYNSYLLL